MFATTNSCTDMCEHTSVSPCTTSSASCQSKLLRNHVTLVILIIISSLLSLFWLLLTVLIVPVVEMSQPICQTYVIIQNTNFMDPLHPCSLFFLFLSKNLNDALKHIAWIHCSNTETATGRPYLLLVTHMFSVLK